MKIIAFISIFFVQLAFSYTNVSNSELEQLIADDAVVVDVRLEEEWMDTGIIQNSKTITYFDKQFHPMMKEFVAGVNKITAQDKNRNIVVVCRTGQRSIVASEALDKAGYKNIYNLKYGIMGWRYDNKKLVKYSK